ncbi:MAG: 30S ribosomal protein S11 [Candidatus Ryanbacteria bacterium CG10_big_fil_rev_8_21_14_0_10_43_42]|uniref:Small ribosomal subunit protein uS11 n=1 Tax=Candidatus Ryanbacteria bacterium CG10_big_fil_rev_8_21_14_0_10_43_42 TaxID=1974864 RepID=A0A2M8KX42_9BACT|nr:MAG: 30S ribosomal protein S11 [Candidatus Ryanbacteria bacterium CG10_big_fil_rev_8_21_14_0_10_43_42]
MTIAALKKKIKRRISAGHVYINSTYNNTIITFTDEHGAVIFWGSAGSLGFSGAKKSTPYAASKVATLLTERAKAIGLENVNIFVRGVGAGRESAIRSIASGGLAITFIKDMTPVPFNGPRARKVRHP